MYHAVKGNKHIQIPGDLLSEYTKLGYTCTAIEDGGEKPAVVVPEKAPIPATKKSGKEERTDQ